MWSLCASNSFEEFAAVTISDAATTTAESTNATAIATTVTDAVNVVAVRTESSAATELIILVIRTSWDLVAN